MSTRVSNCISQTVSKYLTPQEFHKYTTSSKSFASLWHQKPRTKGNKVYSNEMKGEGKNRKCLAYVAIFIVFQAIVITVFALTVMKIKGPKVRFSSAVAENFSSTDSNSSSLSFTLVTRFAVKNTNFGHFKYQDSNVTILYAGQAIGTADIPRGRAKARSTRRTDVTISINTDKLTGTTNLASDMNSGLVPLTSEATLKGKVQLMKVIKKNKSGKMSCTMSVNLANRAVQDLKCK